MSFLLIERIQLEYSRPVMCYILGHHTVITFIFKRFVLTLNTNDGLLTDNVLG